MGAKMVAFAGYEMPVWYSSLKEEHTAVREKAGIFDISHMGVLLFSGPNAQAFLQKVSCNDIEKSLNGKMVYSMLLNESGGVLDDIMVGHIGGQFLMVVNSSNKTKLLAWFDSVGLEGVTIRDLVEDYGFLAIQGPTALAQFKLATGKDYSDTKRFSVFQDTIQGAECWVLRTGYTGEDGLEVVVSKDNMAPLWTTCVESGVQPSGLGARDSLRLEAGLPLYGQELSETITPLMTRYKWVLKFDTDFIGKEALLEAKEKPQVWATVGIEMKDRVIPRSHYPVIEGGEVTSGTLSPSLNKPIAMAMVKPEYAAIGSIIHVEIRGKSHEAIVTEVPFLKS